MNEKNLKKKLGRPRKAENWTAELLQERARNYFDKCDSRTRQVVTKDGILQELHPEPYSIEGLCVYLDITRSEFAAWRKRSDDLGRRAEMIHLKITANRVSGALDGTQNSSFAQFMLKNNNPADYKDKVEVENSVSDDVKSIFERSFMQWVPRLKN